MFAGHFDCDHERRSGLTQSSIMGLDRRQYGSFGAGDKCDQAIKGARWMSRRDEAMKDVVGCEKPRGAVKRALILGCPNGETQHYSAS